MLSRICAMASSCCVEVWVMVAIILRTLSAEATASPMLFDATSIMASPSSTLDSVRATSPSASFDASLA